MGPTASGKSDVAVEIARKFNGEVISADSRQVYKGLDIGTGKITKKEMKGVPHHLIDVVSPILRLRSGQGQFSVSEYVKLGDGAIKDILKRGKVPIICGGTGFYISALLGESELAEVPPNPLLRKKLEKKSAGELYAMLQKLDPVRSVAIDRYNPRRLVRAIEIAIGKGKMERSKKGKIVGNEARSMKYEVCKIGIQVPDDELKARINKRIEKWFKQGLVKEVENLHKKGLSWKRMDELGLEYKLASKYLKKEMSKEEMIAKMQTETWAYAKRQRTWFKRDKEIIWISPQKNVIKIIEASSSPPAPDWTGGRAGNG